MKIVPLVNDYFKKDEIIRNLYVFDNIATGITIGIGVGLFFGTFYDSKIREKMMRTRNNERKIPVFNGTMFEHFLNTADVMKSLKPLSFSIFDYLKRFDSGLRQ